MRYIPMPLCIRNSLLEMAPSSQNGSSTEGDIHESSSSYENVRLESDEPTSLAEALKVIRSQRDEIQALEEELSRCLFENSRLEREKRLARIATEYAIERENTELQRQDHRERELRERSDDDGQENQDIELGEVEDVHEVEPPALGAYVDAEDDVEQDTAIALPGAADQIQCTRDDGGGAIPKIRTEKTEEGETREDPDADQIQRTRDDHGGARPKIRTRKTEDEETEGETREDPDADQIQRTRDDHGGARPKIRTQKTEEGEETKEGRADEDCTSTHSSIVPLPYEFRYNPMFPPYCSEGVDGAFIAKHSEDDSLISLFSDPNSTRSLFDLHSVQSHGSQQQKQQQSVPFIGQSPGHHPPPLSSLPVFTRLAPPPSPCPLTSDGLGYEVEVTQPGTRNDDRNVDEMDITGDNERTDAREDTTDTLFTDEYGRRSYPQHYHYATLPPDDTNDAVFTNNATTYERGDTTDSLFTDEYGRCSNPSTTLPPDDTIDTDRASRVDPTNNAVPTDNSLLALEQRVAEACALVERVLREREEREQFGREIERKEQLIREQRARERREREERELRESEHWPAQQEAINARSQWLCEHYQRHCRVRFPCCMPFYPCHRCHNISKACDNEEAKACHATHLKCNHCQHEQEIGEDSAKCRKCGGKMSAYFSSTCKHFTSVDKNPYHCNKCGICRIHQDKSFHCEVCNVCLDKRLEGNHKCRPDSGHDECCICLEDAFSGCQILPCSHKVHRECAIAMIQNGIRTCPICRHPLYSQTQTR